MKIKLALLVRLKDVLCVLLFLLASHVHILIKKVKFNNQIALFFVTRVVSVRDIACLGIAKLSLVLRFVEMGI